MVVGLGTNSATWFLRFLLKSSDMDVSLVTHLNWPAFLEKFLASSSLQQFEVNSSVNMHEVKWSEGHHRIPWKLKLHVSLEPTMERSLIIEMEEKPNCTSVSMIWWHGYRDYRSFWKKPLWRYWWKELFI